MAYFVAVAVRVVGVGPTPEAAAEDAAQLHGGAWQVLPCSADLAAAAAQMGAATPITIHGIRVIARLPNQ